MQWTYSAADDYVQSVVAVKPASSSGGGGTPAATYTYDANGNMTGDGTKCYEYNEANQLKRVKTCSGSVTVADYIYDYNGNRIVKKNYTSGSLSSTVTSWTDSYETNAVVGGSTTATVYYFANNEAIAKKNSDGTRYYFHNDHLGSTNLITNSSGTTVELTKYDPWGEVLAGGTKSKFLYTGQEKDSETGLHYYNFRYYNSAIRRFIQPDDIIPYLYAPQSLNKYSYVLNNPIKYIDPTGHASRSYYNYRSNKAVSSKGTVQTSNEIRNQMKVVRESTLSNNINSFSGVSTSTLDSAILANPSTPAFIPNGASTERNMKEAVEHNISKGPQEIIWFVNKVQSGGDWDYKNQSKYGKNAWIYEDYGNYNYGSVARAVGFSEQQTLNGAGSYQIYSNVMAIVKRKELAPSFGLPYISKPYGDDVSDYYWDIQGNIHYEDNKNPEFIYDK